MAGPGARRGRGAGPHRSRHAVRVGSDRVDTPEGRQQILDVVGIPRRDALPGRHAGPHLRTGRLPHPRRAGGDLRHEQWRSRPCRPRRVRRARISAGLGSRGRLGGGHGHALQCTARSLRGRRGARSTRTRGHAPRTAEVHHRSRADVGIDHGGRHRCRRRPGTALPELLGIPAARPGHRGGRAGPHTHGARSLGRGCHPLPAGRRGADVHRLQLGSAGSHRPGAGARAARSIGGRRRGAGSCRGLTWDALRAIRPRPRDRASLDACRGTRHPWCRRRRPRCRARGREVRTGGRRTPCGA